jgi:hypothetical protein
MRVYNYIASLFVAVFLMSLPALATANGTNGLDVSGINVDTTPVTTVFIGIAGSLATLWAVRKVINMINKS